MCYRTLLFILTVMMGLFVSVPAYSEGNIGITYNHVVDDRSGGLVGDFKHEGEMIDFEMDAQLQIGDVLRGKAHAEIVFDWLLDIKLATDVTGKGYTLDSMGRDQNANIGFTVPYQGLNFDVGIGGSSASPWAAPSAIDVLVPKGFNEGELEALGLGDVFPKPKGLPFLDGNFLNAYVATGFEKGGMDIDLKGIFQLTGEEKANQVHTRFQTSRDLGPLKATVALEFAFMAYQDEIYYETGSFISIGIPF